MGYTINSDIVKGNDMQTAILTLQFCSAHDLLFFPSLQEWLSFTPVQIEHTFGEVSRLTASACPRCLPVTKQQLPKSLNLSDFVVG
jgi:hypothetical protein